MKRIKTLCLIALAFITVSTLQAIELTKPEDFEYEIYGKYEINLKITGVNEDLYRGKEKDITKIVIPDTIKGCPVRKIDGNAFGDGTIEKSFPNLKTVVLPNTLREIGGGAFSGTALESIDIPDSVSFIAGYAFKDCKSLTYVKLPKKLDQKKNPNGYNNGSFLDKTFCGCTALKTVIVPEEIVAIDYYYRYKNNAFGDSGEGGSIFYGCPLSPESKKAFEAIILKD